MSANIAIYKQYVCYYYFLERSSLFIYFTISPVQYCRFPSSLFARFSELLEETVSVLPGLLDHYIIVLFAYDFVIKCEMKLAACMRYVMTLEAFEAVGVVNVVLSPDDKCSWRDELSTTGATRAV